MNVGSLAAIAVMIYALVTYHWRAAAIAKRGSGPYDDRLGPVRWKHLLNSKYKTNLMITIHRRSFALHYLVSLNCYWDRRVG